MRGKRKVWLCLILLLALVVSVGQTLVYARQTLSYVVESWADGDVVYLIEDDGTSLYLIQTDLSGTIHSRIKTPKLDGKTFSTFDQLSVDHGQVYFCWTKQNVASNQVLSESIYRCNFQSKALEQVCDLPVKTGDSRNNYAVTVRDGKISYVTLANDTQQYMAQALLHVVQPGKNKAEVIAVAQYDLGIGFSDFFYADNGDFIFTTPDGKIMRMDPSTATKWTGTAAEQQSSDVLDVKAVIDSQIQEPTLEQRSKVGEITVCDGVSLYPTAGSAPISGFTSDSKHTLYFVDTTKNAFQSLDLKTGIVTPLVYGLDAGTTQLAVSDLKNVHFTDAKHLTATATLSAKQGALLVVSGDQTKLLDTLTLPRKQLVYHGLLLFLAVWGVAVLLYLLRGLLLTITSGKIPVVTKVLMACIPVVILSMFVMRGVMVKLFAEQVAEAQYRELYLISRQQQEGISADELQQLDLSKPYEQIYYYTLRQLLTALPSQSVIYDRSMGEQSAQSVYDFGYHWLYQVEGNRLVSAFCDQNYIHVPIDYYYDRDTVSQFYQAMKTGKTMKISFHDVGGDWIVLAIPITDESGKVIAMMETGVTRASFDYAVAQNADKVNAVNLIIFVFLMILLTLLIMLTLQPLGWLKKSVLAVTEGNLGEQTRIRGNDEIAEIGTVFNQMSRSVEFHVEELHQLNRGYFKFVPSRMFQILRKSSVIDVRLGDQVHSEISILSAGVTGFDKMISSMDSRGMFALVNSIYSRLVPAVGERSGVIDRFENAGLVTFFTAKEGCEAALTTAVSICQLVEKANEQGLFHEGMRIDMTSGISYGPVMIGIVGHQQRLAATTISEYTNLSGFLQSIAPKYSAHILITASAISHIPDFAMRFHARCIGFIHLSVDNRLEKFYDVYDGDSESVRWAKNQTRDQFERGVALYWEKKFYEARLVFIEVLKQNRLDGAAKEYLYRCDQYYAREDAPSIDVFIERY